MGGRVDKCGGGGMRPLSGPRNVIFVPMTEWGTGLAMGCRDPFTLTSILSHQGRGGKPLRACRNGLFSYQSLMPAGAGTPRYENSELRFYAATSHGGFCHAPRPQRGTSPSPREVFDRTTFPNPHPSRFRLSPEERMGGLNDECWRRGMRALARPRNTIFVPMTNMRFADYRNGLGGLIVSTNCLSA